MPGGLDIAILDDGNKDAAGKPKVWTRISCSFHTLLRGDTALARRLKPICKANTLRLLVESPDQVSDEKKSRVAARKVTDANRRATNVVALRIEKGKPGGGKCGIAQDVAAAAKAAEQRVADDSAQKASDDAVDTGFAE